MNYLMCVESSRMVIKILTHHYQYTRATPEKKVLLTKGHKNIFIKVYRYQTIISKRTIKSMKNRPLFLHPQLDSNRGHIRLRKKNSLKRLITSVCFYTTKLFQHSQKKILTVKTMVTGRTTSHQGLLNCTEMGKNVIEDVSERRKGNGIIEPFSSEVERTFCVTSLLK